MMHGVYMVVQLVLLFTTYWTKGQNEKRTNTARCEALVTEPYFWKIFRHYFA